MMVAINISHEEPSADPQPQPDQPPKEAGGEQQGEQLTRESGAKRTQPEDVEQQEQHNKEPLETWDQSILDKLDDD